MIGKHYDRETYNCANLVAEWYKDNFGIEIPVDDAFDRRFAVWLMRHFTEIKKPEYGCVVVMVCPDYSRHIGVYVNGHVMHNYRNDPSKYGSVIETPLLLIKQNYLEVSYHKWS